MSVTKDQAQMLTALAIACRPHRAPTWDEAGVMAAIAEIRHLSLPEAILRTIRAAADHEVRSPGVIPRNGSHAQEQLKPEKWEPRRGPWCGICGQPVDGHPTSDHEAEVAPDRRRSPETIAQIVEATKAELTPTRDPAPPRERTPDDRVTAARAELHPDAEVAAGTTEEDEK